MDGTPIPAPISAASHTAAIHSPAPASRRAPIVMRPRMRPPSPRPSDISRSSPSARRSRFYSSPTYNDVFVSSDTQGTSIDMAYTGPAPAARPARKSWEPLSRSMPSTSAASPPPAGCSPSTPARWTSANSRTSRSSSNTGLDARRPPSARVQSQTLRTNHSPIPTRSETMKHLVLAAAVLLGTGPARARAANDLAAKAASPTPAAIPCRRPADH